MNRRERRRWWWLAMVLLSAPFFVAACVADPPPSGDVAGGRGASVGSGPEESGRRLALVIGNDAYSSIGELFQAANDARSVTAALESVGFAVETVLDANRSQLTGALATFARTLRSDDVALVYFAGHGVQVDEVNYLLPTDYPRDDSREKLRLDGVRAVDVEEMLQRARVGILILDACRNNPIDQTRSAGGGLAAMEPRGTLIAYAAAAGQRAKEGVDGAPSGLFTSKFIEALQEPGLGVSELFRRVRQEVYAASNGEQFPALYDGLLTDFVFRPSVAVADAGVGTAAAGVEAVEAGTTTATLQMEMAFWDSIRESTNAADFEAYRQRFPRGTFVELAGNRLAELRARPAAGDPSRAAAPAAESPAAVEAALGLNRAARQLVQLGLQREGYSPGVADGAIGPGTRAAIRRWQESRGVSATGYLDAADAEVLRVAGEAQRQAQRQAAPVNVAQLDVARLRSLAEQGDPRAQREFAVRYADGLGVQRDDAEAVRWYRRAAEQGDAFAQNNLGYMYENGLGVQRDDAEAVRWYRRAAEQGDDIAQKNRISSNTCG